MSGVEQVLVIPTELFFLFFLQSSHHEIPYHKTSNLLHKHFKVSRKTLQIQSQRRS